MISGLEHDRLVAEERERLEKWDIYRMDIAKRILAAMVGSSHEEVYSMSLKSMVTGSVELADELIAELEK